MTNRAQLGEPWEDGGSIGGGRRGTQLLVYTERHKGLGLILKGDPDSLRLWSISLLKKSPDYMTLYILILNEYICIIYNPYIPQRHVNRNICIRQEWREMLEPLIHEISPWMALPFCIWVAHWDVQMWVRV